MMFICEHLIIALLQHWLVGKYSRCRWLQLEVLDDSFQYQLLHGAVLGGALEAQVAQDDVGQGDGGPARLVPGAGDLNGRIEGVHPKSNA